MREKTPLQQAIEALNDAGAMRGADVKGPSRLIPEMSIWILNGGTIRILQHHKDGGFDAFKPVSMSHKTDETIAAMLKPDESDSILTALQESVKLQSHYAKLLNMHDGGERMVFKDAAAWMARLASMVKP